MWRDGSFYIYYILLTGEFDLWSLVIIIIHSKTQNVNPIITTQFEYNWISVSTPRDFHKYLLWNGDLETAGRQNGKNEKFDIAIARQ